MLLETIEYKGCAIETHSDEDPGSPREWDNLGVMLCRHLNYILGDRKDRNSPEPSVEEILEVIARKDVIYLPLYLLDHSGIWMRAGAPGSFKTDGTRYAEDPGGWDTSTVGIIYVDFATIRKEYEVKRVTAEIKRKVVKVLDGEVQTYSAYLEGRVCGYVAEGPNGEDIDSCWGFYPEEQPGKRDYDYMLTTAEETIDHWLARRAQQAEQVRQLT